MLIKLVLCAQSLLKFVITLYLSIPFDEREAVKETPKSGYSLRKNIMCIVIYWNTIGYAGSTKLSKENIPCNIRQLVHGTRHQSSYPSFLETRTVLDKERSGRQKISEENVDRLRQSFALSHSKSICPDARQLKLQVEQSTRSYTRNCDCTLIKRDSYRDSNPRINQDEKSLQLTF